MTMKSRLLFGLLLGAPSLAQALGLGDIHLGSALNQPLTADIELLGSTQEELGQIRASLSSRETFARYGLDRPQFLSSMSFKVSKDAAGRNILQVRSSEPMTEPFVTFLVEVTWPRGRLVREYTVLLDPPVYEQKPTAAPVIAAPTTGSSGPQAGAVVRSSAAPVPSAGPTVSALGTSGEYRVAPNDSLSIIARRAAGATTATDVNKAMVATFRANPNAFDGNINRLRKGATLRIPGRDEWQSIDASGAAREVGRQMGDWKGAKPAEATAPAEEAHLRLVPPKEGTGAGQAPAPAPVAGSPKRVAELEKELADTRRLLDVQSQALARLEEEAKTRVGVPPASKTDGVPAPKAPAPAAEVPKAPEPSAETPKAPEAAPATPAPPVKPAAKPTPAPAPERGVLDVLTDNLLYLALGAAGLLAAVYAAMTLRRRRQDQADFESVMEPEPAASAPASFHQPAPRSEQAGGAIVVEESDDDSGEFLAPPLTAATATAADEGAHLEQADPLAEADFHMAYGLYDQAADIVKQAIDRTPARRDLKLKLLEVYFVWGNKDAFLDVARDLGRTREQGPAGEWETGVIMGRQIAQDDPQFAGAVSGAGAAEVDLDLDAQGGHGMDLELIGEGGGDHAFGADAIDLDLGHALSGADPTAETGESQALDPDRIDLMFEGEASNLLGATAINAYGDAPTVEQPGLATPTVETQLLDLADDMTLRDKLDSALARDRAHVGDATAELSLDDLGFDLDKLDLSSTSLEALSATDHAADAPTMLAQVDAATRARLEGASAAGLHHDLEPTRESPRPSIDLDPTRLAAKFDPTTTARITGEVDLSEATGTQNVYGAGDLDLDLDELARALENDTVEQPRRDEMRFATDVFGTGIHQAANGVDLDVGAPVDEHHDATVIEHVTGADLDLPDLEPVTLSEVGTKLDLARAYMDMGDPEGARSILDEVLSEGSASQKQEAQRLIETLPG